MPRDASRQCRIAWGLAAMAGLGSCTGQAPAPVRMPLAGPTADGPGVRPLDGRVEDLTAAAGGRVYVPVYSHVYHGNGRQTLNLTALLSIRNTDPERELVVGRIAYHDSAGRLVRSELERPIRLGPLATTEVVVPERDTAGGSGGSFLVEWLAERPVSEPVIECVMIGTIGAQGISFVCPGRPVRGREPVSP